MNGPIDPQPLAPAACCERLQEMIRLASDLRSGVTGATAVTLDVLCALTDKDIEYIANMQTLDSASFGELCRRVSHPVDSIRAAFRRYLLRDLVDYSHYYAIRAKSYTEQNESGTLDQKLRLMYGDPSDVVPFLHHQGICLWEVCRMAMSSRLDGDPTLSRLYEGFLVTHDLSFARTVDLLVAAKQRLWPGWEKLWGYY
jgi:hypothetical protein